MAQQVKLKAYKRTLTGRNAIKKIKHDGLVPGVIYGGNNESVNLQVNARELSNALSRASSEHVLVDLEVVDGNATTNKLALIQEVQHHALKRGIVHVDFHAVSRTEKITSEVPIETSGEAIGVKTFGGLLEHTLRSLEVECFPQDLPDLIHIDVTNLNVGDSVHVRDIQLSAGVEAVTDGDLTVVSIVESRVGDEAGTADTTASEPEVITEKKAEEGKEQASSKS